MVHFAFSGLRVCDPLGGGSAVGKCVIDIFPLLTPLFSCRPRQTAHLSSVQCLILALILFFFVLIFFP